MRPPDKPSDAWTRIGLSLALTAWIALLPATAAALPATDLQYRIKVRLDPQARTLAGEVLLRWRNRSGQTVKQLPLHLYLNAFAHSQTSWMREAQQSFPGWLDLPGRLRRDPDPWGYLELTRVAQAIPARASAAQGDAAQGDAAQGDAAQGDAAQGDAAQGDAARAVDTVSGGIRWREAQVRAIQPDDGNPLDSSLAEVTLPLALPPGQELRLKLAFSGRLPLPFARTGCVDDFCLVAQWFPKLGASRPAGSAAASQPGRLVARQFHAASEFFAEFADYDVTIDVPQGYTVGATGALQSRTDAAPGHARLRYVQRAVHDFAFVAGRELSERTVEHPLPGGGAVKTHYLIPRRAVHQLERAQRAIAGTLRELALRMGPYPYDTLTVVMPPYAARDTCGMEYPTLITGTIGDPLWDGFPLGDLRAIEGVLIHELIHQYLYGIVANDEQQEAWLDEGLTSFWDARIMELIFPAPAGGSLLGRSRELGGGHAYLLQQQAASLDEAPGKRPAALFLPGTHRAQIYSRLGLALRTGYRYHGQDTLDRVFGAYYERFRFRHPDSADFLGVVQQQAPALAGLLGETLRQRGVPDYRVTVVRSEPYHAPQGRLVLDGQSPPASSEPGQALTARVARLLARPAPGKLLVQLTDPGWVSPSDEQPGQVQWRELETAPGAADCAGDPWYESEVRLQGPGWQHLPVTVELELADGRRARDSWDGRASWRGYRFWHCQPLAAVRVDPEQRVALDAAPQNNALAREPERRFLIDWSGWLAALASWLAGGLSLWL